MPLQVAVGHASLTGSGECNEDFCAIATPEGPDLDAKGVIAAVADGVGGQRGGRDAAEYTVRGLLTDYYATPETWAVARSVEAVASALNRWVLAEAGRKAERAGMATTLSALVLRGRRYYTAHVGDSRIYRLRDGRLERLTVDHRWAQAELDQVLSRGIGLDPRLTLDHGDGDLAVGDRFLLVSDGVWSILSDGQMAHTLLDHPEPRAAAAALTSLAQARGGQDNATAAVVEVLTLPPVNQRDSLASDIRLPLPPALAAGQEIDGLVVEDILHQGTDRLDYRVRDKHSGQPLVLRTLPPSLADDALARSSLLREEWRTRRLLSPCFAQVVPAEHKGSLYYLMAWAPGASLAARLVAGQHFSVSDGVRLGVGLLRAIATLHRQGIAHRAIGAEAVHLGQDGVVRLLDLQHARALADPADEGGADAASVGVPSYWAPERFAGAEPGLADDLYAAGVTLYHLLTRKYPYGEVSSHPSPRFGDPVPPTRWRPEIPAWLDHVLLKAVVLDGKDRFETAEEFILALERGASRPLAVPGRRPLARRHPLRLWQVVAGLSLALNLVLLARLFGH